MFWHLVELWTGFIKSWILGNIGLVLLRAITYNWALGSNAASNMKRTPCENLSEAMNSEAMILIDEKCIQHVECIFHQIKSLQIKLMFRRASLLLSLQTQQKTSSAKHQFNLLWIRTALINLYESPSKLHVNNNLRKEQYKVIH